MENEILMLPLDDIIPNRFQPREVFDERGLQELSASIKEHGVIQPIIVRQIGNKYEIIAGERRYKASGLAGLTKIPAIIRNLDDKESSKVALIENLQRRELSAIEEARTYQKILDLDKMTQEELARTMGKSQGAVANKVRLLTLPEEVQDALLKNKISERHARTLLSVADPNEQLRLLNETINQRLTVKELEDEIKLMQAKSRINEPKEEVPKMIPNIDLQNNQSDQNLSQGQQNNNIIDSSTNPFVNVDQIKANAVDIMPPEKPLADLDSLLKVESKPENEMPTNQNFKFVPSFDNQENTSVAPSLMDSIDQPLPINPIDSIVSSNNNQPQSEAYQQINNLFTSKQEDTPQLNINPVNFNDSQYNEIASPTNQNFSNIPSFNQESSDSNIEMLDIKDDNINMSANAPFVQENLPTNNSSMIFGINTVRKAIKELEYAGFIVDVDEVDFATNYQITIKINKEKKD